MKLELKPTLPRVSMISPAPGTPKGSFWNAPFKAPSEVVEVKLDWLVSTLPPKTK